MGNIGKLPTRDAFSFLSRKGFFRGRRAVKEAVKGFVVKVEIGVPSYGGCYPVSSIKTGHPESPKNDTARVLYKKSARDFHFEDLRIVSISPQI